MMRPEKPVFLSYSSHDEDHAGRLIDDLMKRGVPVYAEFRLSAGDLSQTARALREASAVIVLASQDSLKSEKVSAEWRSALRRGQLVIPALMESVPKFEELPNPLDRQKGYKLFEDYDAAVQKIADAIPAGAHAARPSHADASSRRLRMPSTLVEWSLVIGIVASLATVLGFVVDVF